MREWPEEASQRRGHCVRTWKMSRNRRNRGEFLRQWGQGRSLFLPNMKNVKSFSHSKKGVNYDRSFRPEQRIQISSFYPHKISQC